MPVNHQDRHIKARSRLHRPIWVRQISDIRLHQRGIRAPPTHHPGMAPTYTVLPLRSVGAASRKLSCRAPGPLRPILVGDPPAYIARARAPRHPSPVECLRTGTDPVPRRPTPAVAQTTNTPNRRSLVPVTRRPFLGHLLNFTTGSPASGTLMLLSGPRMSALACP
jgi:hypothetical protein